jgi:hypothetical protein
MEKSYLASSVQAFLSQAVLPSKLGLVLAVATLSAVVILQATDALAAEDAIPDPLAALRGSGGGLNGGTVGSVDSVLLLLQRRAVAVDSLVLILVVVLALSILLIMS